MALPRYWFDLSCRAQLVYAHSANTHSDRTDKDIKLPGFRRRVLLTAGVHFIQEIALKPFTPTIKATTIIFCATVALLALVEVITLVTVMVPTTRHIC